MKVVIKYSVEVDGLPVYTETYDVKKVEEELNTKPRPSSKAGFDVCGVSYAVAYVPGFPPA